VHPPPRLLALGDAAFTVEFGPRLAPDIQARVLGFAAGWPSCRPRAAAGVIEWVPTFRSVTVHFDPDCCLPQHLATACRPWPPKAGRPPAADGVDHPGVLRRRVRPRPGRRGDGPGLSREAVIAQLTATEFTVRMLGFLPGFPYLGGLPASLEMPRLATPRPRVPAGSVAIAGRMGAIYPWDSPGGWRLVGRSPVTLFDAARADRPALFAPGDRVRWQRVGPEALAAS
jgi:KipI family sensor histidine kinase inhibitor